MLCRAERQKLLKAKYNYECRCEACLDNGREGEMSGYACEQCSSCCAVPGQRCSECGCKMSNEHADLCELNNRMVESAHHSLSTASSSAPVDKQLAIVEKMLELMDGVYYKYNINYFTFLRSTMQSALAFRRVDDAAGFGERLLDIQQHYQHPDDLSLLHTKFNLAKLYVLQGKKAKSTQLLKGVAPVFEEIYGKESELTKTIRVLMKHTLLLGDWQCAGDKIPTQMVLYAQYHKHEAIRIVAPRTSSVAKSQPHRSSLKIETTTSPAKSVEVISVKRMGRNEDSQSKLYVPKEILAAILKCFKFMDVQRLYTTSRMMHHLLYAHLSKIPEDTLAMAMRSATVMQNYLDAHAGNNVVTAVIGLLREGHLRWVDQNRLKFTIDDYDPIIERLGEVHTEETIREVLVGTKDSEGFNAVLCGPNNNFCLRFTHLPSRAPVPPPPPGDLPNYP